MDVTGQHTRRQFQWKYIHAFLTALVLCSTIFSLSNGREGLQVVRRTAHGAVVVAVPSATDLGSVDPI